MRTTGSLRAVSNRNGEIPWRPLDAKRHCGSAEPVPRRSSPHWPSRRCIRRLVHAATEVTQTLHARVSRGVPAIAGTRCGGTSCASGGMFRSASWAMPAWLDGWNRDGGTVHHLDVRREIAAPTSRFGRNAHRIGPIGRTLSTVRVHDVKYTLNSHGTTCENGASSIVNAARCPWSYFTARGGRREPQQRHGLPSSCEVGVWPFNPKYPSTMSGRVGGGRAGQSARR